MIRRKLISILTIYVALTSGSAHADRKYSVKEFLNLVDVNQVSFDQDLIFKLPESMLDDYTAHIKKRLPWFSRKFLYFHHKSTDTYRYSIAFVYDPQYCAVFIDGIDYKRKKGERYLVISEPDLVGERIDMKYCERLYGFNYENLNGGTSK